MFLKNSTIEEFNSVLEDKQLICIGAGKAPQIFCDFFKEYQFENKICCFCDNDSKLKGTYRQLKEKSIPIISVEEIKKLQLDNYIVLITMANIHEILNQLECYTELKYTDIYYFSLLIHNYQDDMEKREMPDSMRISKEIKIPKKIHYCWFGEKPLPNHYKKWLESWKRFCPDYEIIQWNEHNYDISKNQYMKEAYYAGKWGFVPDYVRLDIIYQHGGIYLDTDVEIVRNFDDLLYQDGFCGFERPEYVNFGSGFGAIKELPIIKELRDHYDNMRFKNPNNTFNLVPSPHYQTEILKKHGLIANGEYQKIDGMTIYPVQVLSGKSKRSRVVRPDKDTFSVHHYDASWMDEDSKTILADGEKLNELFYNQDVRNRGNDSKG